MLMVLLVPGVLAAVSPPIKAAIQANLSAAQQIDSLNGSRSPAAPLADRCAATTGRPAWLLP